MFLKSPFTYTQRQRMAPSAGFTILEAIFGTFVFTVGILAVASMQIHSLSANANARNITEAVASASNLISDLRPVKYSSSALSGDSEDGQVHSYGDMDRHTITYHVRRLDAVKEQAAVITTDVIWSDRGRQHAEKLHYFKIDEYED